MKFYCFDIQKCPIPDPKNFLVELTFIIIASKALQINRIDSEELEIPVTFLYGYAKLPQELPNDYI